MITHARTAGGVTQNQAFEMLYSATFEPSFAVWRAQSQNVITMPWHFDGATIYKPLSADLPLLARRKAIFAQRVGRYLSESELRPLLRVMICKYTGISADRSAAAAADVLRSWVYDFGPLPALFTCATDHLALFWTMAAFCYRPILVTDTQDTHEALRVLGGVATLVIPGDVDPTTLDAVKRAGCPVVKFTGAGAAADILPAVFWREIVPEIQAVMLRYRLETFGRLQRGDNSTDEKGRWPWGVTP